MAASLPSVDTTPNYYRGSRLNEERTLDKTDDRRADRSEPAANATSSNVAADRHEDLIEGPITLVTIDIPAASPSPSLTSLCADDKEAVELGRQYIRFRNKKTVLMQKQQHAERRRAEIAVLDEQLSVLYAERGSLQADMEERARMLEEMQLAMEECRQSLTQCDGSITYKSKLRVEEEQAIGIDGQQIRVLRQEIGDLAAALDI